MPEICCPSLDIPNNNLAETTAQINGVQFSGPRQVIADGTDAIFTGSMVIGESLEMYGVNPAYIRSIGYNGFDKTINLKFTWRDSLDDLYQKGIAKIVLLGGANLISSFLLEDLIDELQITITPYLLGGDYCWVSSELRNLNTSINKKNNWILKESKKLSNNELLIRYFKNNLS